MKRVTFFEPRPEPSDLEPAPWRPPLWDRPSEGTLGAFLPVGEVVGRDDRLVVSVDHLRVHPNGVVPTVPILRHLGGGGGGVEYRMRIWIFPLPPDGPTSIHVQAGELPEGKVTIEGAVVRAAAAHAQVIWS